jgi:TPR repeat protein
MYHIGMNYMYGQGGVARDFNEMRSWLHRASSLGDPEAKGMLFSIYSGGLFGTPKDEVQGFKY